MTKYATVQRALLLDYLESHPDEFFTAKDLYAALPGDKISLPTLYRTLSALEEQGRIRRFAQENSRKALYQYVDIPSCKEALHITCLSCGKTVHLFSYALKKIEKILDQEESFQLAPGRSNLYGICLQCRRKHENGKKDDEKNEI